MLLFLSCSKKDTTLSNPPDLLLIVKSRTNQTYSGYMNFPQYHNLTTNNYSSKNQFPAFFSAFSDSAEYTLENTVNRKEFYFSIKYSKTWVENEHSEFQYIKFSEFKFTNVNFDSIKFINNELWLYCE